MSKNKSLQDLLSLKEQTSANVSTTKDLDPTSKPPVSYQKEKKTSFWKSLLGDKNSKVVPTTANASQETETNAALTVTLEQATKITTKTENSFFEGMDIILAAPQDHLKSNQAASNDSQNSSTANIIANNSEQLLDQEAVAESVLSQNNQQVPQILADVLTAGTDVRSIQEQENSKLESPKSVIAVTANPTKDTISQATTISVNAPVSLEDDLFANLAAPVKVKNSAAKVKSKDDKVVSKEQEVNNLTATNASTTVTNSVTSNSALDLFADLEKFTAAKDAQINSSIAQQNLFVPEDPDEVVALDLLTAVNATTSEGGADEEIFSSKEDKSAELDQSSAIAVAVKQNKDQGKSIVESTVGSTTTITTTTTTTASKLDSKLEVKQEKGQQESQQEEPTFFNPFLDLSSPLNFASLDVVEDKTLEKTIDETLKGSTDNDLDSLDKLSLKGNLSNFAKDNLIDSLQVDDLYSAIFAKENKEEELDLLAAVKSTSLINSKANLAATTDEIFTSSQSKEVSNLLNLTTQSEAKGSVMSSQVDSHSMFDALDFEQQVDENLESSKEQTNKNLVDKDLTSGEHTNEEIASKELENKEKENKEASQTSCVVSLFTLAQVQPRVQQAAIAIPLPVVETKVENLAQVSNTLEDNSSQYSNVSEDLSKQGESVEDATATQEQAAVSSVIPIPQVDYVQLIPPSEKKPLAQVGALEVEESVSSFSSVLSEATPDKAQAQDELAEDKGTTAYSDNSFTGREKSSITPRFKANNEQVFITQMVKSDKGTFFIKVPTITFDEEISGQGRKTDFEQLDLHLAQVSQHGKKAVTPLAQLEHDYGSGKIIEAPQVSALSLASLELIRNAEQSRKQRSSQAHPLISQRQQQLLAKQPGQRLLLDPSAALAKVLVWYQEMPRFEEVNSTRDHEDKVIAMHLRHGTDGEYFFFIDPHCIAQPLLTEHEVMENLLKSQLVDIANPEVIEQIAAKFNIDLQSEIELRGIGYLTKEALQQGKPFPVIASQKAVYLEQPLLSPRSRSLLAWYVYLSNCARQQQALQDAKKLGQKQLTSQYMQIFPEVEVAADEHQDTGLILPIPQFAPQIKSPKLIPAPVAVPTPSATAKSNKTHPVGDSWSTMIESVDNKRKQLEDKGKLIPLPLAALDLDKAPTVAKSKQEQDKVIASFKNQATADSLAEQTVSNSSLTLPTLGGEDMNKVDVFPTPEQTTTDSTLTTQVATENVEKAAADLALVDNSYAEPVMTKLLAEAKTILPPTVGAATMSFPLFASGLNQEEAADVSLVQTKRSSNSHSSNGLAAVKTTGKDDKALASVSSNLTNKQVFDSSFTSHSSKLTSQPKVGKVIPVPSFADFADELEFNREFFGEEDEVLGPARVMGINTTAVSIKANREEKSSVNTTVTAKVQQDFPTTLTNLDVVPLFPLIDNSAANVVNDSIAEIEANNATIVNQVETNETKVATAQATPSADNNVDFVDSFAFRVQELTPIGVNLESKD